MSDSPEPAAKPKRQRRTKAELEEIRQAKLKAEADKPLTAGFWGLIAGVLFFVTACFYIDMLSLVNYRSSSSDSGLGEIVIFVLALIYSALGRTWGTLIFGLIGLFCLYKAIRRRIQVGSWND
jgi:thiol:disulfide interchange protein